MANRHCTQSCRDFSHRTPPSTTQFPPIPTPPSRPQPRLALLALSSFFSLSSHSLSHFAALPFLSCHSTSLTIPSLLHFLGAFTPIATFLSHTCLPLLNHLSCLSCSSSADGAQLVLRIRLIASADISNLAASACVVYISGNWALSARMPARASGERRFRGAQPSGNFCFSASFCALQPSF